MRGAFSTSSAENNDIQRQSLRPCVAAGSQKGENTMKQKRTRYNKVELEIIDFSDRNPVTFTDQIRTALKSYRFRNLQIEEVTRGIYLIRSSGSGSRFSFLRDVRLIRKAYYAIPAIHDTLIRIALYGDNNARYFANEIDFINFIRRKSA